jgi:Recombination endonuclease VII
MPSGRGKTQAACHPEKVHFAKGLCKNCYTKPRQEKLRAENRAKGKVYPSQTPEAKRKVHLEEHGWTPEHFDYTWKTQNEKCAICNKSLNLDLIQNESRACADHEHVSPPRPRGILCTNCNAMIGQAKESTRILRAAAFYLEKFLLKTAEEVKKKK